MNMFLVCVVEHMKVMVPLVGQFQNVTNVEKQEHTEVLKEDFGKNQKDGNMKLKQDFITNSSSSNYLVFIPENFNFSKFKRLIEKYDITYALENKEWFDEEIETKEDFLNEFDDKFGELIKEGEIWQHSIAYESIAIVLDKLDLVIGTYEGSGSNDGGSMININQESIRKKMKTVISGGWGLKYGGWGHETKI